MKRIGIYSGTFNPIHAGHISFALQALKEAKLDRIYLLPERYRSNKKDVAHFGHRVAMIRQAIKPHQGLDIIESHQVSFSVDKTLPLLRAQFINCQLVFLLGSDHLKSIDRWPRVNNLLATSELVIGIRQGDQAQIKQLVDELPLQPPALFLVDSYAPAVSSTKIRQALRGQQETEGILASVRSYSNQNWLYISL